MLTCLEHLVIKLLNYSITWILHFVQDFRNDLCTLIFFQMINQKFKTQKLIWNHWALLILKEDRNPWRATTPQLPVVSDFTCSRGSYRYQNLKSSSKTTGRLLKPPARHENDSNRTLGSRPAGCCSIRRWSALQENWRTPPARPGGCYHLYHQLHVIAYTREIGEFY